MKRGLWLAIAFLVLAAGAVAETPRVNTKLKSRAVPIRKFVVLPAQVTFKKVGVRDSAEATLEAEQIGKNLYAAVARELALRGGEVFANPLEQAKDDPAKYAISDLQARYDNIAVQVRRKPGRVKSGQFTLSDRMSKFEPGANAEAFVFIRATAATYTEGRKAMAIALKPLSLLSQFRAEVSLVDSKTGEVLAFIRFSLSRDVREKSEERFGEGLRESMRDVPLPLAAPKR